MLNNSHDNTVEDNIIYKWSLLLFAATLLLLPISHVWTNVLSELGLSADAIDNIPNLFGSLILLVAGIAVFTLIRDRVRPKSVDIYILAFGFIALVSFFWRIEASPGFLVGLRYSLFAVVGYFIGRAFSLKINHWDRALRSLAWFIIVVSGLQLVLWISGGESLLVRLGLGIEHFAGSWPRLSGPFSGPNQLATFLSITSLWLYWRKKISIQVLLLAAIVVLLTFSRSAILGLFVGFLIPFVFMHTSKEKRLDMMVVVSAVLALIAASIYFVEPLRNNFVGLRHTDERVEALQTSYDKFDDSSILRLSFGHGAGTSGPASVFSTEPFIPENWLIQTGYEYGVVGLAFLLGGWFVLAYWSYRNNRPWLTAVILAMFVNSLFLHPLSDNFPAAIWFYLLLGAGFSELNINKGKDV